MLKNLANKYLGFIFLLSFVLDFNQKIEISMKRLAVVASLLVVLASCGNKGEVERLQAQLDSLQNVNGETTELKDEYLYNINNIFDNLEEIRKREGFVVDNSTRGEMTDDIKLRIEENIADINALIQTNKETIARLEKNVKSGNAKNKELLKTIANLQKLIEEKDQEIASLKGKLTALDLELDRVSKLYDSLAVEDAANKALITQKTDDANAVYYTIGTFKELVAKDVLDKGGAFAAKAGAKLAQDLNQDYFTRGDLRKVNEIIIGGKKVEFKTTHPDDSYVLEGDKNKIEKVIITDANKFWSLSKYCVIVTN